jgi:uncharacterized protein (TIGR02285 family)
VENLSLLRALMIFIASCLSTFLAHAETPIMLHYVDRPPYAVTQADGKPTGLVASPAEYVFKKAKVPFVWSKTPINRQFAMIKENKGLHCALGMEQTASRSEFAKFTEPVYISQPLVAIMNPRVTEKRGVSFATMLSKYSILVKENYTLGDEITAMVLKSPNAKLTTQESSQMVQMIALGRHDFMMISNDEVEYYIKQGILNPKGIRLMELPGAKKRFTRRMMCSKLVDDKVIQKLNRAIRTLNVKPAKMSKLDTLL